MPANPLSRLVRRHAALPPQVEAALKKLARLGEQQPELRELAQTNAALLQMMYTHELPVPHVAIDAKHAGLKHEPGIPLLRGEPIAFDERALRDQFVRLCGVMQGHGNQAAAALGRAAKGRNLSVAALAVDVIAGEPAAVAGRVDDLGLDAGLGATLLRLTLFPLMVKLVAQSKSLLASSDWRRGYCPACGMWPLLGEYRGLELTRFLRCGLCASEWEVDRLVCIVCDNRLHQDLKNLSVEGEEQKQRAVACERCHCYVKQVSTLAAIPAPELLVTDLQSLHLDLIALQRNYLPPQ